MGDGPHPKPATLSAAARASDTRLLLFFLLSGLLGRLAISFAYLLWITVAWTRGQIRRFSFRVEIWKFIRREPGSN
jgi:hypothetical protein